MTLFPKDLLQSPVLAAVLLAAATCGGEAPGQGSVTVRDSAGITIVESRAPRWGQGEEWRVDPEPLLDLTTTGSSPEHHEFEWVTDLVTTPDGGLALAESGWKEVRFYDARGHHVRTVGREGEGPGEFDRINDLLELAGDSLGAEDNWMRRLTIYDAQGELGRIVSFLDVDTRDLFPLPDGGFLAHVAAFSLMDEEIEGGLQRQPSPIVRLDALGEVRDTVAVGAGFEHVVIVVDGEVAGDAGPLFRKSDHMEVRDGKLYVGAADSLSYEMRDTDGRLLRLVRVPGFDLSVPPEMIEARRERLRASRNPIFREIDRQTPDPTSLPAYSDLVVDELGNVWLEAFLSLEQQDEPRRWRVFDPEGAWLGEVLLPPRFTVFGIGRHRILGARRDELDVAHPQVLALERGVEGRVGR